MPLKASAAFS